MRYLVKNYMIKRLLLDIKYYVKGSLIHLRGLKGLNVGKVSIYDMFVFNLIDLKSCPFEVGLNGVNVIFPVVAHLLKLIYAES